MTLISRLQAQIQYQNIDEDIIQLTLKWQAHLQKWKIDTHTPQVEILLFHLAMALGRIKRGACVSALHPSFFQEIKDSQTYPKILYYHQQLLSHIPFHIPANEQTHLIANLYALSLSQPILLSQNDNL